MDHTGRIFLLADDIDTDQLAPGRFMKGGIEQLAAHCLETIRPDFAETVTAGDIIVAGRNFGLGSSREQAAQALIYLGIQAVVAQSFGGIFYRNAINLGLPALPAGQLENIRDGDLASVNIVQSTLTIHACEPTATDRIITLQRVPENVHRILIDGGLVAHLKKRFAEVSD